MSSDFKKKIGVKMFKFAKIENQFQKKSVKNHVDGKCSKSKIKGLMSNI